MNDDESRYIPGRSTAGFIYNHSGTTSFFHTTAEPNRKPMEFPPECIACSSEMGLVLLCRLTNAGEDGNANTLYLVSNPSITGSERNIPNPPRPHPNPMPRVLIVGWDPTRLCLVFHIVCAVQAGNRSSYSFDVYSSNTDTWVSAGTTQVHLGLTIMENTGVACGTRAYWLLDIIAPTIAYYDVHGGRAGTISLSPDECPPGSIKDSPQLGRWGCQLCLVVISDLLKTVRIFTLGQDDRLLRFHDFRYGSATWPTLSRFQSAKLQVPVMCELGSKNRILFFENGWRRKTTFSNHAWSNLPVPLWFDIMSYVLPHVATDWLPLLHFPIVP